MPLRESAGVLDCDFSSSLLEWRLVLLDLAIIEYVEGRVEGRDGD